MEQARIRTNLPEDPHRIPSLLNGEILHEGRINCIRTQLTPKGNLVLRFGTTEDHRHYVAMNTAQFDLFIDRLIELRRESDRIQVQNQAAKS